MVTISPTVLTGCQLSLVFEGHGPIVFDPEVAAKRDQLLAHLVAGSGAAALKDFALFATLLVCHASLYGGTWACRRSARGRAH